MRKIVYICSSFAKRCTRQLGWTTYRFDAHISVKPAMKYRSRASNRLHRIRVVAQQSSNKSVFRALIDDPILEGATKVLSLLSVALLSFALAYDIGFFAGVGDRFFSFFSLSEHILFAIRVLPVAFGLVVSGVLYVYVFDTFHRILLRYQQRGKWYLIGYTLFVFLYLISLAAILYNADKLVTLSDRLLQTEGMLHYMSAYIVITCTLFFAAPASIVFFDELRNYKVYILSATIYTISFLISFFFGYVLALSLIINDGNTDVIKLKDSKAFSGTILMAGEKGVLLYISEAKEAVFVKWENLEQASTPFKKVIH
jgi:uncharacterized membrane protein (Fun14 family)